MNYQNGFSSFYQRLTAHLKTPLFLNGYALVLSALSTSGLGILYWILAARRYPEDIVGLNSAAISAMMLLSGISQLNLRSPLIRFLPRAGTKSLKIVVLSYGVTVTLSAVIGIIFFAGLQLWSPALNPLLQSPIFIPWFIISIMGWDIFVLQDNILTGLRRALWIPVENTLFAILKLILLVVFSVSMPLYGIFASWTLPMIAIVIPINIAIFRRLLPIHVERSKSDQLPLTVREVGVFAMSDYLGSLFTLASTLLLPLIVTQLAGAKANAYFYLAWTISNSLVMVANNMSSSLTVEAALDERKLRSYTKSALVNTMRLLVPLVLLAIITTPLLLSLFGKNYTSESSVLLRLLVTSVLPSAIIAFYMGVARIKRQLKPIILIQFLICVLVLGGSIILLPMMGITGVGIAWLFSQSIIAIGLGIVYLQPLLRKDM